MARLRSLIPSPLLHVYHALQGWFWAAAYGFPARGVTVIGVTGTNGKTTTCHFITAILKAAGHTVGMQTTIDVEIAGMVTKNNSKMTTPGRRRFNALLRQMRQAGCTHLVLETSSHAIDQSRIVGIPYTAAVLTNITRDHLDYHKTMDAYAATKLRLWSEQQLELSVINRADPRWATFYEQPAKRRLLYGLAEVSSEQGIAAEVIKLGKPTTFSAVCGDQKLPITLNLPGRFNIENAMAAIAVGVGLDVPSSAIASGIASVTAVAGRMELVEAGQPFTIILDYAHTPDALEKLYQTVKPETDGRLIAVLGATGNRDRGKRPTLGALADQYADIVVLTDEDPYDEDPAAIITAVQAGVKHKTVGQTLYTAPNRADGIRQALDLAQPGDSVIISGKGAEEVMAVAGGKLVPWSDRKVVERALAKISA